MYYDLLRFILRCYDLWSAACVASAAAGAPRQYRGVFLQCAPRPRVPLLVLRCMIPLVFLLLYVYVVGSFAFLSRFPTYQYVIVTLLPPPTPPPPPPPLPPPQRIHTRTHTHHHHQQQQQQQQQLQQQLDSHPVRQPKQPYNQQGSQPERERERATEGGERTKERGRERYIYIERERGIERERERQIDLRVVSDLSLSGCWLGWLSVCLAVWVAWLRGPSGLGCYRGPWSATWALGLWPLPLAVAIGFGLGPWYLALGPCLPENGHAPSARGPGPRRWPLSP